MYKGDNQFKYDLMIIFKRDFSHGQKILCHHFI